MSESSMERTLKMAVVTGLRAALGPALLAQAQSRPERNNLALAALGEMVFDKIPFAPSRDTLVPLLVRGLAGAWVASKMAEREPGEQDPWAVPLGAAVAMGVAVAAPKIRKTVGYTTGISQPVLGLIEDYIALKVGTQALGMSMEQVGGAARESVDDLRERLQLEMPEFQSTGAGSM